MYNILNKFSNIAFILEDNMWNVNNTKGFFVAIDGPNGVGKSTLMAAIKNKMEAAGYTVYTTKEPTDTELGGFIRKFAENHSGKSLACLVAADRYEHISNEITPKLKKGALVITDRYVLSSLILQEMDGVSNTFILDLNADIVKPDLQLAIFANEEVLQKRLADRTVLTRFERGNQSNKELIYMESGIVELEKLNVNVLRINNNDNFEANVEKIITFIVNNWRSV